MRRSFSPWLLLSLVMASCAAALIVVSAFRARHESGTRLIERLPEDSSAVIYVDFAALRRAGILAALAGPAPEQEAEYRAFVEGTGFEYTRDLDSALMAVNPNGKYFLARGRFDWNRLKQYVESRGGQCRNAFCRTEGSRPDRRISYFPIERDLMALAVSPDGWAAEQLQQHRRSGLEIPGKPVWAIFTPAAFSNAGALPEGARTLAQALSGADRVVLTAGPSAGGVDVGVDITCASPEEAAALKTRLAEITALLGEVLRGEGHSPDPEDLTGVLAGGQFELKGSHVTGSWPVSKAFLERLTGPGL